MTNVRVTIVNQRVSVRPVQQLMRISVPVGVPMNYKKARADYIASLGSYASNDEARADGLLPGDEYKPLENHEAGFMPCLYIVQ